MNIILNRKFLTAFVIGVFALGAVFIAGCKKNDGSTSLSADQTVSTTDDVADLVADGLASNNGGAMDQTNDAFEIAGAVGVGSGESLSKTNADSLSVQRVYDSTSVSWTTSVYRAKVGILYSALWTRTYWHQFWANGKAQKFKNSPASADTINYQIKNGAGFFWTPRLTHVLTSIGANWTASSTNTDTVTLNGAYTRSGVDTVKVAARRGRILVGTLTLNFVNVRGPKGLRRDRSAGTTGTINGKYTALVTVSGTTFAIEKDFTITLSNGTAKFTIDGTVYTRDLATGDPL